MWPLTKECRCGCVGHYTPARHVGTEIETGECAGRGGAGVTT